MGINNYKDLFVWQKSMKLVKEVYSFVKKLPSKENYILISQMLRAAISVPSNIAEGFARNRNAEFIRFLEIAYGSLCELETQLLIAKDEYNLTFPKFDEINALQRMIRSLIQKSKH